MTDINNMDIKVCCLLGHHTHLETQYHFQQTVDCLIEAQCSSETAVWLPKMLKQCSAATLCYLTVLLISQVMYMWLSGR